MPTRIFSIRHHGPGSAQNLQEALGAWQPQQLLIEGPPEAETVTDLARSLEPPVALLLYSYDQPQTSVYYPFTIFSPEWQALQYGLQVGIPIHWLDLPQTYQWVRDLPIASRGPAADPLQVLAQAAGEGDGDRWWEELIEQRPPSEEVFDAILEAMSALRDAVGISESDRPREAAMRQTLRRLQRESPQDRLAVICGAWHGPALSQMPPEAEDQAQLAQLQQHLPPPSLPKVQATWIPWSYRQLATQQGYGAGMASPGWYHYLWESRHHPPEARTQGWLTQMAHCLREAGQPPPTGAIIEAVRLANSLAALRDRPQPGFRELQDAAQAVMLADSPHSPHSVSRGSPHQRSPRLGSRRYPHHPPTARPTTASPPSAPDP